MSPPLPGPGSSHTAVTRDHKTGPWRTVFLADGPGKLDKRADRQCTVTAAHSTPVIPIRQRPHTSSETVALSTSPPRVLRPCLGNAPARAARAANAADHLPIAGRTGLRGRPGSRVCGADIAELNIYAPSSMITCGHFSLA